MKPLMVLILSIALLESGAQAAEPSRAFDPAPTTKDWATLAALPDWSGVWVPDINDHQKHITSNPPPWLPAAAAKAAALDAEERAGHPRGLFVNCLPEGMPSLMLITHNSIEFLFVPGRVIMLGESDGGRERRIYTDGRSHPSDPDPSFHGHSIGHWEGDTLVVDTVGILPESYIAVSEAVGLANNGDLHVIERLRVSAPNTLTDELTIIAPKIFSAPWKTTRVFFRDRARQHEIVEGSCLQGKYAEGVDANGDAAFIPLKFDDQGAPIPPDSSGGRP